MASLLDFYQAPQRQPTGFSLADIVPQEQEVTTEGGIQSQRMLRDFSMYNLPDLTSRFASRGTFFSGGAGRAADRMRTGVTEGIGDIERATTGRLAELARARALAVAGV